MLRSTATCRIAEFRFGHPSLKKHFGPIPRTAAAPVGEGYKRTKLENGVTVVTRDAGGPNSAFGFYAESGAKFDPATAPGLSYVLRWAIQTSNMDNSLFQLDRTMRAHGFSYGHGEIRKRFLSWKGEGRRDLIDKPFSTFASCISAPRFHEADVERFRDTMDNLLEEQRWQNPREYCVDQLETIAYYKEPLGNPRHVWAHSNDKASSSTMLNHWASHFTPNRITISAVNVDHEHLVSLYQNCQFPHSSEAPHHARARRPLSIDKDESLQFVTGNQFNEVEARSKAIGAHPDMPTEVISAFGWSTAGRDGSLADYAAAAVATEVLSIALADGIQYDRHSNHKGIRTFYRPYSSTGLFGFTVRGTEEEALRQVHKTIEAINNLKPTEKQRTSAISRASVRLFHNELERTSDLADFLATSTQSPEEIENAFKTVTLEQIEKNLKVLTRSQPASFATGDVNAWPSIKQFGWH